MSRAFLQFILIITFLFSLVPVTTANAEESNYEKSYQDYIYTYNKYRESYNQFITAKQAYLNYQTLNSKNEAQTKTLQTLQLRDEAVKTYLTMIRFKLAQVTQVSDYNLNLIYLKLEDEIGWYSAHKESLTSAGTLEDLVKLSTKSESYYQNTTQPTIYKTLFAVIAYKEKILTSQTEVQMDKIKSKLGQIDSNNDKNTTKARRWLLEAENRLNRSKEKQKSADTLVNSEISSYQSDHSKKYYQAQFLLSEANQYLEETNSFLKEVLVEVKSAD